MESKVDAGNINYVVATNVRDICDMKDDIRNIKKTNTKQDDKITTLEITLNSMNEKVTRTDKTLQWVAKTIILGIISVVIAIIGNA